MRRLRRDHARRVAIRAAGLDRVPPEATDVRHFRQVVDAIDIVQLDSVNVLCRAHELAFFARIGAYDREALRRWLWHSREMVEGWAHVASLTPMEVEPFLRFRQRATWQRGLDDVEPDARDAWLAFMAGIQDEVEARGPLPVSDLSNAGERTEGMWGWSPGKTALWRLHHGGRIAVHQRLGTFVAEYTARTDVVPAAVRDTPDVPAEDAHVELVRRAARSQGFGTPHSLGDHYRIGVRDTLVAIERLEAKGELVPIEVEGVDRPTWAHVDMVVPRAVDDARALVSPFDPLIWFRDRVESLWDMHYRIGIYTPAAERTHGYYTLPFLLGERLVARVDLKADRHAGTLLVQGAWAEPGTDLPHVADELLAELASMAAWLELDDLEVKDEGDLAPVLRTTRA